MKCKLCNKTFISKNKRILYCSKYCKWKRYREKNKEECKKDGKNIMNIIKMNYMKRKKYILIKIRKKY